MKLTNDRKTIQHIFKLPSSELGWTSIKLTGLATIFGGLFLLASISSSLFDNLVFRSASAVIAILMLLFSVFAFLSLSSWIFSLIAIIKYRERSWLVWLIVLPILPIMLPIILAELIFSTPTIVNSYIGILTPFLFSTPKPIFDGDAHTLTSTKIVATLDAPIIKGTNTIWCASFQAVWKFLEKDLIREPLILKNSIAFAQTLNSSFDPRPYISDKDLFITAGWQQPNILNQIKMDLMQKFPNKPQLTFPEIPPNSIIMYGYIETKINFPIPYFQNQKPLLFIDRNNQTTALNSFGIRSEDGFAYDELRMQAEILFNELSDHGELKEFIIDLDRNSKPNQIILAMIEPKATLEATVNFIEEKINTSNHHESLGPNDVLLVPEMVWRIKKQFTEIEGNEFLNQKIKNMPIGMAQQDIQFSLTRNGVELMSEFAMELRPRPKYYIFNSPFIIYMKRRVSTMPYFVMSIENAELLNKWK